MKLLMTSSTVLQKSAARAREGGTFLGVWLLNDCTVAGFFFVDFKVRDGGSGCMGEIAGFLSVEAGAGEGGFASVCTLQTSNLRGTGEALKKLLEEADENGIDSIIAKQGLGYGR